MLSYKELLKNRRSIRDYIDKNVSLNVVHDILKESCLAPSACNKQPWRFIVIENKEMMKRLSDESKKNLLHDVEVNPDSPYKKFEKSLSNPNYNVFYNAPCLVMIVGQNNYGWFYEDCTLAATYFMFAAVARELGTCWIGLGDQIHDTALREEIGLPEDYEIVASLILGYPKKIPDVCLRADPIVLNTIE